MSSTPRSLYVYSADGLANRLLVLLSGRAIAEASGRAFGMDWQLTPTCACPFDRLFEGDWNVRLTDEYDDSEWRDLRLVAPDRFPDLTAFPEPVLRIRHHISLVLPELYPHHHSLERRMHEWWRTMQPVPEIQSRIREFQETHFRPVMIGVHLRRGDFYRARPDIVNNLDDATAATDHWLALAPDAGILLCTDDGAIEPLSGKPSPNLGVREAFQKRYGNRVVSTNVRSLDRATMESIQDALQDLLLLRRTQFLVGTTESTFSNLAVFGRDLPYRMVGGPTAGYCERQRRLKRTGVYYVLRALGILEFGARVPHFFVVRVYKERIERLRRRLKTR